MMNEKKSILIFIDWFSPAFKGGGPIQSCINFTLTMSSVFNIYVVTSDKDLGDTMPLPNILIDRWTEWRKNIYVFYVSDKHKRLFSFKQLLQEVNPNFVYLQSMYSVSYTILPLFLRRISQNKAKWILSPRGMLQKGALQFKPFKKQLFLKLAQNLLLKNVYFHATDEQEKKDISRQLHIKDTAIEVISNFSVSVFESIDSLHKKKGMLKIVYISRITAKKNLAFFLALLKSVQGEVLFTIVGHVDNENYWQKCKEIINTLPSNITIDYKGALPNNQVQVVLKAHHLSVLPTFSENFGHSIFESFAVGRPVLISDQTPWKDLQLKKAGWSLPLSQTNEWKKIITEAIEWNQAEFNDYSNNSWLLAREHVEKSNLKEAYLKIFS